MLPPTKVRSRVRPVTRNPQIPAISRPLFRLHDFVYVSWPHHTRITLTSLLVNPATASSDAPASVTSTSTPSIGQINDRVTTAILLPYATTMTCLACLTIH